MAASLTFKDASAARGAEEYTSMAGFYTGRTVALYVNGNYAGVQVSGPHDLNPTWGSMAQQMQLPAGNPAGAQPAAAVDMTDGTKATGSITLT